MRIPRSKRHEDGSDTLLNWLETHAKDNPTLGNGGGSQFVQQSEVAVDIIDLDTGQIIRDPADLAAVLGGR